MDGIFSFLAEMMVPYQLIGFGVDYANGVKQTPTPVEELNTNMQKSQKSFKNIILKIIENIESPSFDQGFVYTFEQ